jgi:dCTP deaminase
MILTGNKIKEEISTGRIAITPYRHESVQPNGYDFHLGEDLIRYYWDEAKLNYYDERIFIPEQGYLLNPGELYLGITEEITASDFYSQLLYGDKSIGSLGIWVQISAPLAHVGSNIRWTLEIRVLKKTIIYPGMKFGKICFLKNSGKRILYKEGKYWNSGRYKENEITPSLIDLDIPIKDF